MNVFLACFLAVLLANATCFLAVQGFVRWQMRRMMRRIANNPLPGIGEYRGGLRGYVGHAITTLDDGFACNCGETFPVLSNADDIERTRVARLAQNHAYPLEPRS